MTNQSQQPTCTKEALAALVDIEHLPMHSTDRTRLEPLVATVRQALQSVAQEREDLAAVNAWLDADDERYQSSGRQYVRGYYLTLYPNQMRDERRPFYGDTRAEALSKAAAFCRAEMASKS